MRGLQGLAILISAFVGLLLAAKLGVGASQKPCLGPLQIEVPGVAASCLAEQAAWWGLALGALGGALAAVVAIAAWNKRRE